MSAPLLTTHGVTKRFGGLVVSENVSIDVMPGELHAIIGPNGAGKTTLLNQIGGQLVPNAGSIVFDGVDVTMLPVEHRTRLGIGRTFQVPRIFGSFPAVDNPAIGALGRTAQLFGLWTPLRAVAGISNDASAALGAVALSDRATARSETLSHGDRRLLEIATALAGKPRLLLLDEPMAGLGRDESLRMSALLKVLKRRRRYSDGRTRHGRGVLAGRYRHRAGTWQSHRIGQTGRDPQRSAGARLLSRGGCR